MSSAREAAPAQAFVVGAVRLRGIALHRHVRRHVLQHDRERGEHRVRADAAELVHAGERAEHRPVADVRRGRRSARCSRTSCGCRPRSRARRACRRGTGCRCRSACRRGPARCRRARSRTRGTCCRRRSSCVVGSPPYLRSCAISPIDANWKMRLRSPMRVRAPITTCGPIDACRRRCATSAPIDRVRADLDVVGELARRDRRARWDGRAAHASACAAGSTARRAAIVASVASSPSTRRAHLRTCRPRAMRMRATRASAGRPGTTWRLKRASSMPANEMAGAPVGSRDARDGEQRRRAATSASSTSTPGITG